MSSDQAGSGLSFEIHEGGSVTLSPDAVKALLTLFNDPRDMQVMGSQNLPARPERDLMLGGLSHYQCTLEKNGANIEPRQIESFAPLATVRLLFEAIKDGYTSGRVS